MITVTIDSPKPDLGPHWDDLVARASPNVFMDPAALLAAVATGFAVIRVLLAWEGEGAARKLVGVWALRLRKFAPLWPIVLDALPFNYAFVSSPVVDPAYADAVIAAFLSAIGKSGLPKILNLSSIDAEGPVYSAILRALAERGAEPLVLSKLSRPYVTSESGVKRSGSTRKKLRQDWNRLSALGTVDIRNDRTPAEVQGAFEIFLALEKASWKGERGTALLSHESDAAFVRRLIQNLAERQNASVAQLRVNGEVIAAQVLMYCGNTAYTWKTAFDAGYARYSPGTLLVDKITDELLASETIRAVNSCAAESSFMGQLWSGRRAMADMLIDVGPGKSFGYRVEALRLTGYQRLRDLRDRLRERPALPAKITKVA
ncbi:GNAT family N-acetyltransferase [Bradyrhizobium lablabi]|nr:GNAT family N-acetyltransferase [Bradyrhizobium lablabi]MBR1124160.1 GNAT family N-acetyltransferase [Bradyrhizobium lablabi]